VKKIFIVWFLALASAISVVALTQEIGETQKQQSSKNKVSVTFIDFDERRKQGLQK
jgi:hypothetical protein